MSYKLSAVALIVMLYNMGAWADGIDTSIFSFNGFGTLGVVHSSADNADFASSVFQPKGVGHSNAWSAAVDSLIAGQVTAQVTPHLSVVVQVIAQQNFDNTYRPHVEWANIKYRFTPDFSVRVGRTVLPAFLLSDTREVAFTYPWVRPPPEVYGLEPITYSDGLDVSYRQHFREVANTIQVNVGQFYSNLPNGGGAAIAKPLWSVSDTVESGPLTAHIFYFNARATISGVNPFFDTFRQFGPQGVAIANRYDFFAKPLSVIAVGASYDPGDWFVMAELGHNATHSVLGEGTAWYLTGGYQFGKFTPYVTYAQATANPLSDPGLNVSAVPPSLVGSATDLNAALNSSLSENPAQTTFSIGGRWDFVKDVDLKLQFDHTRLGSGSSGLLINVQPGFKLGSAFDLFSASIDFVF